MVKFACDCCGRSYSVAEELRGRAFKMKCKLCGHLIVVKPSAASLFPEGTGRPASPSASDYLGGSGAGALPIYDISSSPESASGALPQPSSSPTVDSLPPFPVLDKPPEAQPPQSLWLKNDSAVADVPPFAHPEALHGSHEETASAPPPLPTPGAPPETNPPEENSPPAPTGYLDYLLDEKLGHQPPAPPLSQEPPSREHKASTLQLTAEATPPPQVPVSTPTEPEQKDPFAGWFTEEAEAEPVPPENETPPDTEVTAPTTASRKVRKAKVREAPVPVRKPAPVRKKGKSSKALILFAAGALLAVVAGATWLATREPAPMEREPPIALVPGAPLSSLPPAGQQPQMAPPQLASPDPQYSTPGDKSGAKTPIVQPGAPADSPPERQGSDRPNGTKQAQIIATQRQAFDECTAQAASRNPALKKEGKKATLIVTVVPSGDITAVRFDDPSLDEPQLTACLKRAAKRMVFPSFEGAPLLVDVPISFNK